MKSEIEEYLNVNLMGATLKSFGVKNQFIELEFSNDRFEEIMFFIDCKIFSLNSIANQVVQNLKIYDEDTFEISYFILINREPITDINITKQGDLLLTFSNKISIVFDLNSDPDNDLSITFLENINSRHISISLNSEFDFELTTN